MVGLARSLPLPVMENVLRQRARDGGCWWDSRRLTKATGALVLQEAEKIRALVRESSR